MGPSTGPIGSPVVLFRNPKPLPDEFLGGFGSTHAAGRLFLEHVKEVHCSRERNRVRCSIGVPAMIFYQFHDFPGNSLSKWPGTFGVVPILDVEQRGTEDVLDLLGHRPEVLEAGSEEVEGFALPRAHVQL